MFGKKCMRCGEKVSKESNFCPHCGLDLSGNYNPKNYGMLGKDDFGSLKEFPIGFGSLLGNLSREIMKNMNSIANDANINNMNGERIKRAGAGIKNSARKMPKMLGTPAFRNIKQSGISISITASSNGQPKINVRRFGDAAGKEGFEEFSGEIEEIEEVIPKNKMSMEKARKYSKLPREEAKSNIRRIADKIIYEIDIPGVKSLDDVVINKLENGIEIKAFTENKSYFKTLSVNYPITNYKLVKGGKLVLEMTDIGME